MLRYSEVIIYNFIQIRSVHNKLFKFLIVNSIICFVIVILVIVYWIFFPYTEIPLSGEYRQGAGTGVQLEIIQSSTEIREEWVL